MAKNIFTKTSLILFREAIKSFLMKFPTLTLPLREKCQNTKFFCSVFSRIWTEYGEIRIQSECGKIRTRKNSVFGHFSRSGSVNICSILEMSQRL